jgi:mannose-1-phosphate guanylyltransferase/mannose-6-phosphate isomerase
MENITTKEFTQLTDHRPWGSFTILADEPDHKVKRIVVKPGQRLSLQRHKRRQEHWLVVSGQAMVTRNDELLELGPGEAVDIALGDIHRVQNDSASDMVFIEIQLGDYFGEDDIERLEDDYGRQGTR